VRLGRPERRALAGLGVLLSAGALEALALLVIAPDPRPLLARRPEASLEIVDRHGQPLRHLPAADGTRYRPVDLRRVSPHLVRAVLAAEDRRFFRHSGADPWALARAAWRNLAARRVVSGGSTLSMQLARLIDPHPRGLEAKIVQVLLAQRLELALSKRAILTEYLARVPMGNRVVGLEAAASVYLGKPASDLSPAEAALLACVPRSPSRVNPWRREQELRRRRDRVLEAMGRLGWLDEVSLRAALAEPMVLARDPFRLEAPHFLGRVREEAGRPRPGERRVISTLDGPLERRVEALVRRHLERLGPHAVGHMAVAVLDVERGEWLALEGSGRGWGAPGGAIDGTRVARQPGSALKPFTYALAFDRGLTPATVIPDVPRSFPWATGTWTPRNYDDRFHGPLRARAALACSVNVPAALVLNDIGPGSLLDALREAGLTTLLGGSEDYGLGLTLGAGEVRLDELTNAYAALVRGGEWRSAVSWRAVLDEAGRVARRPSVPAPRRICSPRAAAQVVDILSDAEARAPAFGLWSVLRLPFPAMVKTGTSEGFRDNWCIGGTREVVAGVWCGNFDRSPMGNVSGVEGAGSLWREVLLAWAEMRHRGEDLASRSALQDPPSGLVRAPVCALSGLAPSPA
jgi:penicillin-binding protein 1C